MVLALFGPTDEITAIFYLIAVVCFAVAAFVAAAVHRFPGGSLGLVALGLGFWLFPQMWNTFDTAF